MFRGAVNGVGADSWYVVWFRKYGVDCESVYCMVYDIDHLVDICGGPMWCSCRAPQNIFDLLSHF